MLGGVERGPAGPVSTLIKWRSWTGLKRRPACISRMPFLVVGLTCRRSLTGQVVWQPASMWTASCSRPRRGCMTSAMRRISPPRSSTPSTERYLRGADAPERVVGLVAFHSSAETEAEFLGLGDAMREFADERTLVRDLLWYADMTIGPSGEHMTFERRMAEVRERYPDDHYVVQALDAGMDERRQAVARAERWIEQVGLTGQV
jgi:hypothetical protein